MMILINIYINFIYKKNCYKKFTQNKGGEEYLIKLEVT